MPSTDSFKRVLAILTKPELVEQCKEMGIKGYSKLKKSEIIDTIAASAEEELPALFEKLAKKALQDTIAKAGSFIGGQQVGVERFRTCRVDGDSLVMEYTMMRDEERFTGTVPAMGAPEYDFSCTCTVATEGGLCMHYWTAILFLMAKGRFAVDQLGDFSAIAGPQLEGITVTVPEGASTVEERKDTSGMSYEEALQAMTEGKRYSQAMVELGLEAPAPAKKAKRAKASGEGSGKKVEFLTDVKFLEKEPGPPARIVAGFTKIGDEGGHESVMHVFIDEASGTIAHENCMDFQMRMARNKQFCKHLVQVFHFLDETTGRRLIEKAQGFRFLSVLPKDAVPSGAAAISASVMETTPSTLLEDSSALKEKLMSYFIEHEGEACTEEALAESLGEDARKLLSVLVAEGMVEKSKDATYRLK